MTVGALGGTLRVINRLVEEGLLLEYAVAGRVATLYYTEPGLMVDALDKAASVEICGVRTRILRSEYLAAIMLKLYRPKDRAKLDLLIGNKAVKFNQRNFLDIVRRHNLTGKWNRFNES